MQPERDPLVADYLEIHHGIGPDASFGSQFDDDDINPSYIEENPFHVVIVPAEGTTQATEVPFVPSVDESPANGTSVGPLTRRLDTYAIRKVAWLDKPFLQRAAFTLVAGRKGVCKGTWTCRQAARVTTGELYGEPKTVLVVTSEDSVELDYLPRFLAAGGDPTRVHVINSAFRLPTNTDWLEQYARNLGDVGLIVVDPLGNHLGGVNTDQEGVVRDAIGPLNEIADRLDTLIIGIRHLSKDASRGALASVLGSTAWVDVPRCVILMARDDQDDMLFHYAVVAGNRGPRSSARVLQLELVDVPPATEITHVIEQGESSKDVEALLGPPGTATTERSLSAQARERILEILETEGDQESDTFDARIANDIGVKAKTVRNLRGQLKNEGLIAAHPDKDEHGTVTRWLVRRTLAPRNTDQ